MAQTNEFIITQPPSSGEVLEYALEAMRQHTLVALELLPVRDIPKPIEETITLEVLQLTRIEGFTKIRGRTAIGESILITANNAALAPAIAHITKA